MLKLAHLQPELLASLRRMLTDPSVPGLDDAAARQAVVDLPPRDLERLAVWQRCLSAGSPAERFLGVARRVTAGRPYRRSVIPGFKALRKVDFGDGLELRYVADHPAAEHFMRHVMPGTGIHEPELIDHLRRSVRKGDVVVDIGAHVGYVSCVAGALGATVIAVEMQPTLIPMIQANAAANDIWTVHPLCAAIGDRTGFVPALRLNPSPGFRATITQWEQGHYPLHGVNHDLIPLLTLDSLFPGPPYPTFVKVDVEGAEARVIAGARRLIEAAATSFMVEVHAHLLHWNGNRLADILEPFPEKAWTLSLLTAEGAQPLSREMFVNPDGPVARHAHNAPVLFEPRRS